MFAVELDSETAEQLDLPAAVSLSPVSLAVRNDVPCVAEQDLRPRPLETLQEEEEDADDDGDERDEDDDSDDSVEEEGRPQDIVEMIGILSLEPFKVLRGTNRVLMGPGEVVSATIEVKLDDGTVIILDGIVEVIRGQCVVDSDQRLQGRDLTLGVRPLFGVEGKLLTDPQTLRDVARNCGTLSVSAEVHVLLDQLVQVTPQFGHFVEADRDLVVSNDLVVQLRGQFQAHSVHEVPLWVFDRQCA
jgi:hypothetical protein